MGIIEDLNDLLLDHKLEIQNVVKNFHDNEIAINNKLKNVLENKIIKKSNKINLNDLTDEQLDLLRLIVCITTIWDNYSKIKDIGSKELWNKLGLIANSLELKTEAEKLLRIAIFVKDDYTDAWKNLGEVLEDQQKFPEAEQAFETALKYKPEDSELWAILGFFFYHREKYMEAEEAFRTTLK